MCIWCVVCECVSVHVPAGGEDADGEDSPSWSLGAPLVALAVTLLREAAGGLSLCKI